MLGRQHLMLSVATVSALLVPYIQEAEFLVLTAFVGASIGSLIPDVDAQDAAIFHRDVKGLNTGFGGAVNRFVGPVLPFFGYSTKYFVYLPVVKLLDFLSSRSFQCKHRAFSHSILGVATITVVTGLYLTPLLIYLNIYSRTYLTVFLMAYMAGAFLHLLQDSCTKTGIAWNSPFSETKIKGNLTTGKDKKKPRAFLYCLGMLSIVSMILSTTETVFRSTAISLIILTLSWTIFVKIISGAGLEKN